MSSPQKAKTHAFQAEVQQLLQLVAHSLYSNKEVFVRELISNASDACDKLRFLAIDNPELWEDQSELSIQIEVDNQERTISFTDNGIGMSAQDTIDHLGTIAKSGTKEFIAQLASEKKADAQMIGQFGVGFYSAFVVASKVVVESRKAGLPYDQGVRWESDGSGEFTITPIVRQTRGSTITLYLREDDVEFCNSWTLRNTIRKYSDHISLPIQMRKEEWDKDKKENITTLAWETINKANAIWARSRNELEEKDYHEFYKQISFDSSDPLAYTHNRVEGRSEYTQLLFIPAQAPFDLWNREKRGNIKLYVKRVFIMDDAQALLPTYLRFIKGVIDSNDLPLNVSRELLQENRDVKAIRDGCTKRILSMLDDLAKNQQEKYATFWTEFGNALKEGVGEDFNNQEALSKLLRFHSTKSENGDVSLEDYVTRMKEGQEHIYYLCAEHLAAAKSSPQLELFRKKDIEVLLMNERIDEWMMSSLNKFGEKTFQSVARGGIDLSKFQDEAEKAAEQKKQEESKPLLEAMHNQLKDQVSKVQVSSRLVESVACIVAEEGQMSLQWQRMLKQAGQTLPEQKPTLEINTDHALIKRLQADLDAGKTDSTYFNDLCQVIYAQALLAEGEALQNPAQFVKQMNRLLCGE